jgi:hypothetical protein
LVYIPRFERGGKLKQTWSLLSNKEQVRFHVLAAEQEYDYPVAFGADLDPEEPVSIDRFHRLLAQHLKYRLGYREFIAVLDVTETDRPHFHGVVCCHTEAEEALAKKALEKASGKWRSRCHQECQIWTKKLYTPRRWAWYICKKYKTTVPWTKTHLLCALAKGVHRMQIRDEAQELMVEKSTNNSSENDAPDAAEALVTQGFPTGSKASAP